ncbi:carboxylesterase [Sulfolobus sp. A20]|uniref:alpha/beta hydrolase n=1 Tax=Sulfolobaceae TaxID=118883 RepID=UPI000846204E|nr:MULTISPECIES: alpha/beta hydrolase [unclassified Sulfolobus]TRM75612.1 alpha/beta hydrolase [Sulfolobus sp. E5]TRM78544.1 alpha/beta hydrolase [Sulfolobus sp. A20-N-F8]TRM79272.1 alpha/beta hydrolase [Sulfolobus sp. B5]TRM82081.1 alpha/beta hydrolase [Sulfolobus sp. D5]TRM82678.1 alpha/beta hydrolase [Sulfolobus sp. A20-N-F6]TRM95342.1 alpha/beta hydrolase [Sulfolobus sp. A20-N-G8]TRM97243.1 alpha/beta hydrolase [Sulfolobus sp. F1]TRN03017.1 alpha/beta hydrolase [Sulfolobus sp. E1]
MPLDPEVRNFLQVYYKANLIDFTKYQFQEIRHKVNELLATAVPKEPVGETRDMKVKLEDYELPIRIYSPIKRTNNGLVMHFHGGAWILGSIETEDAISRILSNSCECTVISVDYRLAPEYKFPTAVYDCFNAIVWARDNAGELGIDKDKIATFGISAGGNLVAATSLLARDNKLRLAVQVPVVPFVYLDLASKSMNKYRKGYFLDINLPVDYGIKMYIRDEKDLYDPLFSPLIAEDLSNLPRAIIVTAEYDPLRDQGEAYAYRLMESGVPTLSFRVNGNIHAFLGSPRTSRQVTVMIGALLKDIFK